MKKPSESPTINDIILFELEAPNAVTLDNIKIYFLEKNSLYPKNIYEFNYNNSNLNNEQLEAAKPLVVKNFIKSKIVASELELVCDVKPGSLTKKNNTFEYIWDAKGSLPGDYFIEWSWSNNNQSLKQNLTFSLKNNINFPRPYRDFYDTKGKYETLIDRFMPSCVSRYLLSAQDCTPQVLSFLNKGVAKELAFLEDHLNTITEIYDANIVNDFILQLLASSLGRKLRTDSSILWKRQVKNAIKLAKKKGTQAGLEQALEEAGIKLKKITKLWQVISQYYYTESFRILNGQNTFKLSKPPLSNVEIFIRFKDVYQKLDSNIFDIKNSIEDVGKVLLVSKQLLQEGYLKVRYNYREVPADQISLEEYINNLPLSDNRDESLQEYPLKNWNVKLIEEDDPLFNLIIQEKHPFYDPVHYGKIRTTFLFSENIYNMDTYNGSLRNSNIPCDIDREFLDSCSYGQSSKFNIDLEISELSDDRIEEAKEIIKEFIPFHALLNDMNLYGVNKDYILAPVEDINLEVEIEEKEEFGVDKFEFSDNIFCKIEYENGKSEFLDIGEEK